MAGEIVQDETSPASARKQAKATNFWLHSGNFVVPPPPPEGVAYKGHILGRLTIQRQFGHMHGPSIYARKKKSTRKTRRSATQGTKIKSDAVR